MRQRDRPVEVGGYVLLVGVDEDQIERLAIFRGQLRKRVERTTHAQIDDVCESRSRYVRSCNVRVHGRLLQSHDPSSRSEAACEPYRTVAAECTDLEDRLGAQRHGEQLEQFPLSRRDADRRHVRRRRRSLRSVQRGIRGNQLLREVAVDRRPCFLIHRVGSVIVIPALPAGRVRVNTGQRCCKARSRGRSGPRGAVAILSHRKATHRLTMY